MFGAGVGNRTSARWDQFDPGGPDGADGGRSQRDAACGGRNHELGGTAASAQTRRGQLADRWALWRGFSSHRPCACSVLVKDLATTCGWLRSHEWSWQDWCRWSASERRGADGKAAHDGGRLKETLLSSPETRSSSSTSGSSSTADPFSEFGRGGTKIEIGSLVIDDAHACLATVADQFKISKAKFFGYFILIAATRR